jgi:hypothetical protein
LLQAQTEFYGQQSGRDIQTYDERTGEIQTYGQVSPRGDTNLYNNNNGETMYYGREDPNGTIRGYDNNGNQIDGRRNQDGSVYLYKEN